MSPFCVIFSVCDSTWLSVVSDESKGLVLCSPAGSRRSVYVQSTLKRRPGYRTLERDLIRLQQQQLFQHFVVVSLRKSPPGNTYSPEITQQFPNKVRGRPTN